MPVKNHRGEHKDMGTMRRVNSNSKYAKEKMSVQLELPNPCLIQQQTQRKLRAIFKLIRQPFILSQCDKIVAENDAKKIMVHSCGSMK